MKWLVLAVICLTGCEMLVPPLPIVPPPNQETPIVPEQVIDTRCDCGCKRSDCDCGRQPETVAAAPLKLEKPIVTMLTDFESGCPACDAAWAEWQRDGDSWPFILRVERPNRLGGTSPTFAWQSARGERIIWRPTHWTGQAALIERWRRTQ